jgi:hypothetical protein
MVRGVCLVTLGRIGVMSNADLRSLVWPLSGRPLNGFFRPCPIFFLSLTLLTAGCERMMPLDTKPLDSAGMNYTAIKQLVALHINRTELDEVAKARNAGFSDEKCIEIVQVYHGRKLPFNAGDTVAGLLRAGLSQDAILELAKLNAIGVNIGELQLIRLAGFSDAVVLEVARQDAAGKHVLSGASLSTMKNAGMHEAILLELVRRGVPDSEAPAIIALHRHGAKDSDLLRRYPAA